MKIIKGYEIKPGANLSRANLSRANLSEANLSEANLSGANLSWADLYRANLYRADLSGANLSGANLSGADLSWANLSWANLSEANLSGAKLPKFQIPQEGTLTVWKKAKYGVLVKLLIPENARRTGSLVGRKCRAEFALPLEIYNSSKEVETTKGFKYTKNTLVYPDSYNDDIRIECTNGIHFFLTKEEAEEYN
jgi:hypothetical protein